MDLLSTPKCEGGPIPWDAIVTYAAYYKLDPIETDDLVDIIGKLDIKLHVLRRKDLK